MSPSLLHDALLAALHPDAAAAPAPAARPNPVQTAHPQARVLLVEDHPTNRAVARGLLALQGVQVDEAVDGAQAVEKLRAAPPGRWQVVFMDMQMPVLDGLAATRAIRAMELHRTIPIIAMTANAMAEDRDRCLAAGMDGHLAKPIIEEELEAVLARWIGHARPADTMAPADAGEPPGATPPVPVPPIVPAASPVDSAVVQEALAQLEQAVAHDIRGGLGVVSGFGKLLAQRLGPVADAQAIDQFSGLQESAREVTGLVDAWRAAGTVLRRPMERRAVDMEALAREAARGAGIQQAQFAFEPAVRALQADPALLERVWHELLANARKFAHGGREPRIETWGRIEGGAAVFGVRDDGIGIPTGRADRLFRPLQRLHGDVYPGAGLGLFIASRLVARHGGAMWLDTSGAREGTAVCFRLPA